jgi:predicted glutamine amidotransferase
MCGISGYIGQSKRPKLTYELITSLFDCLELRGIDASGVWGTEFGENSRVVYHKEPVRSSEFIKQDFWLKLRKIRTDMLLVHSRATSSHGGHPEFNANNHPFVSSDKRIGMVHNGTIEEADYLKNKYETVSETDSECLLRIFEHGIEKDFTIDSVPEDIAKRIGGIKDIWSYISSGAMAVALGERVDDYNKNLFLFRNEKRPLWLADLRDILGQIFFFSSPDIWYSAIGNNQNLKKQCWSTSKLIEIPPHEIWCLNIDYNNPTAVEDRIYRFKVEAKPTGVEFSKGDFKSIKPSQIKLNVITDLDENEKILECDENKTQEKITPEVNHDDRLWYRQDGEEDKDVPDWSNFNQRNDHEDLCKKITQIIKDINITADNLCMEGSMNSPDYEQLIESLEQTKCDLEGTLQIIQN